MKFVPETGCISFSWAADEGRMRGNLDHLNDLVGFTELTDVDVLRRKLPQKSSASAGRG